MGRWCSTADHGTQRDPATSGAFMIDINKLAGRPRADLRRRRRRRPARPEGPPDRDLAGPRRARRQRVHARAGLALAPRAHPGGDVQEPEPPGARARERHRVRRGPTVVYPVQAPVPPRGPRERVVGEQGNPDGAHEGPVRPGRPRARRPDRRSFLGSRCVLAVAIVVLLLAFGWTFLQDPSISAPTRDPAWYTWRSNLMMHDDPGLIAGDWGPVLDVRRRLPRLGPAVRVDPPAGRGDRPLHVQRVHDDRRSRC